MKEFLKFVCLAVFLIFAVIFATRAFDIAIDLFVKTAISVCSCLWILARVWALVRNFEKSKPASEHPLSGTSSHTSGRTSKDE